MTQDGRGRRHAVLVFLPLVGLLVVARAGEAQWPEPRVFQNVPAAWWISHPTAPGEEFGVFHFRRTLELAGPPDRFVVHVSADNRYRLFVNGQQVSSGPQRSDLMHWRYETVDLAPHLRAGRNVLAALVWNWGAERPVAQFSRRTALLLQGDSEREAVANTGPEWKVLHDAAYEPVPVHLNAYYASPPGEAVDGRRYPWGWEGASFPDEGWASATAALERRAGQTEIRGTHPTGEAGGWQLVPRTIPPMEEKPVRFARVRRAEGVETDEAFLGGRGDLVVPPRTRAVVLLDQSHLTNAYAVLETSGGSGSTVALTYAEALVDAAGRKGDRNDVEGKTIVGIRDIFRPDGGERRRFQTLWFRTYRYVQAEIQTADQPLRVHDLHGVFTAYPFELRARFESDLPWLADMWTINWRGARLCAFETYFDTPYYEQLQYVGDTRIQALITLYMTGDDRLVRQALSHFDLSRIPEGITASRYPSSLGQYIPTFSLLWIAMVHDYWMHRDDPEYVRGFLPGVRGVVGWFERRIDETGLVGPVPWWPYVDWVREWPEGNPPQAKDGHSTVISLQLVYALDRAAELEGALGLPAEAERDRRLAESLRASARARAWDPARGLFRDAPDVALYSQQTNIMAVLADAVPPAGQRGVMERVLADATLTRATYYFGFYLFEALRKAGLGERYVERLEPWRGMLAMGLTTVPETPEPTRSDSHAWSAHPNYGLLATVLGVRPDAPGFRSVRIAPRLGPLQRAEGRVPHPLGDVEVRLVRTGARGVRAEVTLPEGLTGAFEWEGEAQPLHAGRQTIAAIQGSNPAAAHPSGEGQSPGGGARKRATGTAHREKPLVSGLPARARVLEAMRRANTFFVGRWPDPTKDIVTERTRPSNLWTRAVYYEGLMALHAIEPDEARRASYYDYAVTWASSPSHPHTMTYTPAAAMTANADNQACGQTYVDLYRIDPRPERVAVIRANVDAMIAAGTVDAWTWIDAIQMAMPVFAKLGRTLGATEYFDAMWALYEHTRNKQGGGLFDPGEGLWWRDHHFSPGGGPREILTKALDQSLPPRDVDAHILSPNGRNVYWSRGNGWVMAALVRVLDELPATDPHRARYIADFKAMAAALRPIQRRDGFWTQSLADPAHCTALGAADQDGPETSGTALFTYGLAWGIRNGHLDAGTYGPALAKAWHGLTTLALQPDGLLGYVQSTGDRPCTGPVPYGATALANFDDYGVGCFLLAGSEVYRLAAD